MRAQAGTRVLQESSPSETEGLCKGGPLLQEGSRSLRPWLCPWRPATPFPAGSAPAVTQVSGHLPPRTVSNPCLWSSRKK